MTQQLRTLWCNRWMTEKELDDMGSPAPALETEPKTESSEASAPDSTPTTPPTESSDNAPVSPASEE